MAYVSTFRSPAHEQQYLEVYDRAMRECPPPDAVHDVETRHGSTRVYRFGAEEATPLVLLPGALATAPSWASMIPPLAEQHAVYAVDILGEGGRSTQREPMTSVADRAVCLDDALGALGLDRVHVVGASGGGWQGFNLAIHAPGRVASLTLLDATMVTVGMARAVLWRGALAGALGHRGWRWVLRWMSGSDPTVIDRPELQLPYAALRYLRLRVPFQRLSSEAEIRSITVPVVAIFGGRSRVHDSAAAAARMRELVPHSEVEILPDAGHDLFLRPVEREIILDRLLRLPR